MKHRKSIKIKAKKYIVVPVSVDKISLFMLSLPQKSKKKGGSGSQKRKHFWENKTLMSHPHVIGNLEVINPSIKIKNAQL